MPALYFFPKKWFTQWEEISKDDCVNVVKTGKPNKGKKCQKQKKIKDTNCIKNENVSVKIWNNQWWN